MWGIQTHSHSDQTKAPTFDGVDLHQHMTSYCTGPVKEGSVLPANVPEPRGLCSQVFNLHPPFVPCGSTLVVILEQQGCQKHPRLQNHVLLLCPQQSVGRIIHEVLDLSAWLLWDVSENGEFTVNLYVLPYNRTLTQIKGIVWKKLQILLKVDRLCWNFRHFWFIIHSWLFVKHNCVTQSLM